MITASGVHIQKIGGAEGTPTPLDIAIHAGRLCRFGGAIWYPLLPHLVFVGLLAFKRSRVVENLVWGFLHDAHECVTGDVPRPFKCECMRTEQKAIDERILSRWFGPRFRDHIDFDLIHKCDIDACDIEAVELKLPGYVEITKACARAYDAYRAEPHADPSDVEMFRKILASPFYQDCLSTNERTGTGPVLFCHLLNMAKQGMWDALVETVDEWGYR